MNATVDFYLQRAADSADAASKTDLVNVRERCLRAEAAWRAMAERLILVEEKKKRDALAKGDRRQLGAARGALAHRAVQAAGKANRLTEPRKAPAGANPLRDGTHRSIGREGRLELNATA